MGGSSTWKLIQKRVYDVLSHRYGTIIVICGCILVIVSALQFGEVAMEWSTEKYAAVFNSFSDNVAGKSFRNRLCLPVPIDVVYTWVNGSDPKLLRELHRFKTQMEVELNETSLQEEKCSFAHCVPGHLVVIQPGVPPEMSLGKLAIFYPALEQATRLFTVKNPLDDTANATVLVFTSQEHVDEALKEKMLISGKNASLSQGYYTSDWMLQNTVLLSDTIVVTGFPHTVNQEQLLEKLPQKYGKSISKVEFYADRGVAILVLPDKAEFSNLQEENNVTIEGKEVSFLAANLIWDLHDYSHGEDVASNRFEDNEELRYSLRSIERFAPWVRHVYIVTNGQIPSWLNLDSPRMTLVTHEELFSNKSHLPAFGSPAIESHLHQIPGLSDKFIYLNDDVMFGREVWPDDFYTHAHGQKIYLTWPVPNCQDGCPSSWIRDGYCDKACNNTECEWDGGDCAAGAQQNMGWGVGGWQGADVSSYCNAGCSNNWISDRYCDQSCSVYDCGFDAGDCGTKNFDKLYEVKMHLNKTHYSAPRGEIAVYINTTSLFGPNSTVESGSCNSSAMFRTVAIAQKFKVITIVMTRGHNATTLYMELKVKRGNDTMQFNFTLDVDTRERPQDGDTNSWEDFVAKGNGTAVGGIKSNITGTHAVNETKKQEEFVFREVPTYQQAPKAVVDQDDIQLDVKAPNMSEYELPEDVDKEYKHLLRQLKEGDITEKGFHKCQSKLWEGFVSSLKAEGKLPEKAKPKPVETDIAGAGAPDVVVDNAGAGAQEQKPLDDNAGVGAQEQKPLNDNAGAGAQEQKPLNDNAGAGAQEQKPLEDNAGAGAQEQKPLEDNAGAGAQEQKPLKDHDADAGAQEQKPLDNAGAGAQEQKPLEDNAGAGAQEQKPLEDNAGAGAQEQKPLEDNAGAGAQEEKPLEDNAGVGAQEEKPLEDNAGAGAQEEKPVLEDHDAGAGAQPGRPKHVDVREMEAVLGIIDHDDADIGAREPRKMDNQIADDKQQPHKVDDYFQKKQQHLQQSKEPEEIKEDAQRSPEKSREIPQEGQPLEGEGHQSRKLQAMVLTDRVDGDSPGFLPWEKQGVFAELQQKKEAVMRQQSYEMTGHTGRRLLDTFGDSLRHVNKLYNKAYGYSARKVPAHMPHMVDKNIMQELQDKYPEEWDATSSHRIRSSTDMQFAFSYFYYVMSEPQNVSVADMFDEMDVDHSETFSDREIRTLATRLYDLPLDLQTLTGLEALFINCSEHLPPDTSGTALTPEKYYDNKMPQVTKHLVVNCPPLVELLKKKFPAKNKYKHELTNDEQIAFKMIHTNVSGVVGQLDDIRKNPKKFICLNDNIEHGKDQAKTVKAVLQDFYESLFPIPSSFELGRDYRNRFLHIEELNEWKKYRDWLRWWTQLALGVLILFTLASFFSERLEALQKRYMRRRTISSEKSAESEPHRKQSPLVTV